jgi:Sensors of blue-light using FAD
VTSATDLHFVYLSRLAPGLGATTFDQICRHARSRNPQRGIAGALLFDGTHFLQWSYGRRSDVQELMASIVLDRRHTMLSLHLEAVLPPLAVRPVWLSGHAGALEGCASRLQGDAPAVLEAMARLIDGAHLDPPLSVGSVNDSGTVSTSFSLQRQSGG